MAVSDELIDACGFRMFELHEIARTMQMHGVLRADRRAAGAAEHVLERGAAAEHLQEAADGNKRERMAQYGNAVTPPVMSELVDLQVRIDARHERWLTCTRCGSRILVCCHVADINPATYVGLACGCRLPGWPGSTGNAAEALGRARTAQQKAHNARAAT